MQKEGHLMFDAYSACLAAEKLPLEITSIICHKGTGSLYIGHKNGHLSVYSPKRNKRESEYNLESLCKNFERKPVLQMSLCDELKLIFCVSDGLLTAHQLDENQYPVVSILHKVKPVMSYVVIPDQKSNSHYILVSSRKRFHLFQWADRDFHEMLLECDRSFSDSPVNLKYFNDNIFLSTRDEYLILRLYEGDTVIEKEKEVRSWSGQLKRIATSTGFQSVVLLTEHSLVGLLLSNALSFFKATGLKSVDHSDVVFSEPPLGIVYDGPYVVALLSKGRVEVRSLKPSMLVQSIVLSKVSNIAAGMPGNVLIGSSCDVWIMDSLPNVKANVDKLCFEKHFDLAIQIAASSDTFTVEKKLELKKQFAFNLFRQKRFEESFNLHLAIETDVSCIVHLFPELLPETIQSSASICDLAANDKQRAMLALGNYLAAVRTDFSQRLDKHSKSNGAGPEHMTPSELENVRVNLQIVDTTLLKCYLKTKPIMVDSLLRLHNNSCNFEDAEAILLSEKKFSSLFVLYETRQKHELALHLLYDRAFRPDPACFFEGCYQTVNYLQTLGNNYLDLIFQYSKWVFARNLEDGLSIFISDDSDCARSLDRDRILEFLRHNVIAAVIPYLEHLIFKWDENRPQMHEALLEHYVAKVKLLLPDYVHVVKDDENITRAGEEEGELGSYRESLLKFLQYSLEYSPQSILLQLSNCPLYEERALILGRMKLHEQALTIYTTILNNFEAAEDYCKLYYNKNDESNSQVYLHWLRAYLCPSDPSVCGMVDQNLPVPKPNIQRAIQVLTKYANKINTIAALSLLPRDTPLRTVSLALNAVLQTVQDEATFTAIKNSVCSAAVEKGQERLRQAESTRILVTNASECQKCFKKIGNSAFVRYPADGSLAHFYCQNEQIEEGKHGVFNY